MPMTFRYPNLISLASVELSDESRGPLQEDRDERSVVVDLASGKKRKWIKSVNRKWQISWENLASNASETLDGKAGRDEIRALAESGATMTLKIHDGKSAEETYTVFIESYSDSLVMRRTGFFRYSVSLGLEEQG